MQSDLLIERRRLDQARALLAPALKAAPEDLELLHRCAVIDYLDDEMETASRTVGQLLSRAPSHYGGRIIRAEIHEHFSQFAEAESVWLELIRDYPESADLYSSYARLMLATLNLEKARALAAEALRFEPEHDGGLYVAATCDLISGRRGARSHHLETLVREHPEKAQAVLALIVALSDRGEGAAALRLARELLRSDPGNQHYVELVKALAVENHWSLWPLYPMRRWGWAGAAGMWAAMIVAVRTIESESTQSTIVVFWLAYVAYSWFWPTMLPKLLIR